MNTLNPLVLLNKYDFFSPKPIPVYLCSMEVIIDLLGLYLLYKLVFDFIVPMASSTKEAKKQFSDIQDKMKEQAKKFEQQSQQPAPPKKTVSKEDYIDFEEVK